MHSVGMKVSLPSSQHVTHNLPRTNTLLKLHLLMEYNSSRNFVLVSVSIHVSIVPVKLTCPVRARLYVTIWNSIKQC